MKISSKYILATNYSYIELIRYKKILLDILVEAGNVAYKYSKINTEKHSEENCPSFMNRTKFTYTLPNTYSSYANLQSLSRLGGKHAEMFTS